jgi:hypothetical protein
MRLRNNSNFLNSDSKRIKFLVVNCSFTITLKSRSTCVLEVGEVCGGQDLAVQIRVYNFCATTRDKRSCFKKSPLTVSLLLYEKEEPISELPPDGSIKHPNRRNREQSFTLKQFFTKAVRRTRISFRVVMPLPIGYQSRLIGMFR